MSATVAIVGSREFPDLDVVREYVRRLPEEVEVVSGGARGVDTAAEEEAHDRQMPVKVFPAEWDKHGKGAGFIRNRDIVKAADFVVAFWDGESRGTRHTIREAVRQGKPMDVFVRPGG